MRFGCVPALFRLRFGIVSAPFRRNDHCAPAVDRLNREVAAAIAEPAVRERFSEFGAEPLTSTPEELGKYVSAEMVRWRDIMTESLPASR